MAYREQANALMAALAVSLDDSSVQLDTNGVCMTEISGIPCIFSYSEEFKSLFIQCVPGSLHNAASPADVMEQLLLANHLWQGTAGGIWGVQPSDGTVSLSYRLEFPFADDEEPVPLLGDILSELTGAAASIGELLGTVN